MSAVSTRSSVRQVSGASVAAAAGAALVATIIRAIVRERNAALARAADRAARELAGNPPVLGTINALPELREERAAALSAIQIAATRASLSALDRTKLESILAASHAPFRCANPASLTAATDAVLSASSVPAVESAHRELLAALEHQHTVVLVQTVGAACRGAAEALGLDRVRIETSISGTTARVVAQDAAGRVLVSEVRTDPKGNVGLESEIVGVTDGSCNDILDRFDRELERQGVLASTPARRFTGGVCETAAARDVVRGTARTVGPKRLSPEVSAQPRRAIRRRRERE